MAGAVVAGIGGANAGALITLPAYARWLGVASVATAAGTAIAYSAVQAGGFIYMKATNPDMELFPED